MRVFIAAIGLCLAGGMGVGCASHGPEVDGPARAMERLPRDIRVAAEAYVEALHGVASTLTGVTDTASAREAMPALEGQLTELTRQYRVLENADERKQADARYGLYRSLASAERRFESQVARVKGTPGVGSVLAPLLDKIPRWR